MVGEHSCSLLQPGSVCWLYDLHLFKSTGTLGIVKRFDLSVLMNFEFSLSPSLPPSLPPFLQWSFTCFSESTHHGLCFSTWEIYAIILPILIALTYLPSYRLLAYAAYIGSVFLAIAMVVSITIILCMYCIARNFCQEKNFANFTTCSHW